MIEATFSDRRAVEKGKPALMKLKMLKVRAMPSFMAWPLMQFLLVLLQLWVAQEVRHMMESHPHQPFLLRGTPTDPNSLTLLPVRISYDYGYFAGFQCLLYLSIIVQVLNDWLSCKHGLPVLQIRTELLPALKNLPGKSPMAFPSRCLP